MGHGGALMAGEDTPQNGPENADQAQQTPNPEQQAVAEAAAGVELVVLPIACVNQGKGAPLGMGVQRWWAQEVSKAGGAAAAPVFTALADHQGRKVPALMVYQDAWTDERAKEGIDKFPNAKQAVLTDLSVADDGVELKAKLVSVDDGALTSQANWSHKCSSEELPAKLFEVLTELSARAGHKVEHASWQEAFGTENTQAMLSFLVGLGNLSALQGRCVRQPGSPGLWP